MKKMLLLCLALGIAPGFAADLPKLPGTPVKVRWGAKQAVAACENGVWRAAGIKQNDGVEYISFRVPLTGDVKGKAIGFSARTTTPGCAATTSGTSACFRGRTGPPSSAKSRRLSC